MAAPYVTREDTSRAVAYSGLGPRPEFGAPTEDAPYLDNPAGAWAPRIGGVFSAGTDAHRLQQSTQYDMRPDPMLAPERHYGRLDADDAARHSVESVDSDGWTEQKGSRRFMADPRSVPTPEPRPTQSMAPRSYTFTRPFGPVDGRALNGLHFSMADHRRNYEILGMEPVRSRRNTYRVEPKPWDTDIVDMPTDRAVVPVEVPINSRSFRLM